MANVLDEKLQSFFVQLNDAEKKSVILMLKTFLNNRINMLENTSEEDYNNEIDQALAEAEAGNYISQSEMEKQATKW